jgi:hypothetical protein
MILKGQIGWDGLAHLSLSGLGQVTGCCERGNEYSGLVKCGEFIHYLETSLGSQEGFCSMELVLRDQNGSVI